MSCVVPGSCGVNVQVVSCFRIKSDIFIAKFDSEERNIFGFSAAALDLNNLL